MAGTGSPFRPSVAIGGASSLDGHLSFTGAASSVACRRRSHHEPTKISAMETYTTSANGEANRAAGSFCESCSERRSCTSNIGPRIIATTMGATG